MATIGKLSRTGFILLLVTIVAGCQKRIPEGIVGGTITLDGAPVPEGLIRFVPTDGASQPGDSIIQNGTYRLTAPIGEKKVEIFWMKGGSQATDTASQVSTPGVQMIPERYNTKSTLNFVVEGGNQTKDFVLKSK